MMLTMRSRFRIAILLASALFAVHLLAAQTAPNSPQAQAQHYVVLVSLGGFRWDFAKRDGAKNLLALARQGASAPEGMLPSYPSETLPNEFSLITGLFPEHHGMVADSFRDPALASVFDASDSRAASNAFWYSGTPLWSLAESQGIRTASIAWPESDTKIAEFLPAYSLKTNGNADDQGEIRQIQDWLRLSTPNRPHLITLYIPEVENAAKMHGPDAPETKAAVLKADALIGKLKSAFDATGLPIDFVVVSDHGMAKTEGGWITLDQFADLSGFDTDGALLYGKTEADRERVYNQLKKASGYFVVYRLKNVPAGLHLTLNPRAGDPVVIVTGPYAIRAHAPPAGQPDPPPPLGISGLDPRAQPAMKAIFYAAGPDIVAGSTVGQFENVNLYPWLAHMLGLTVPKTDGNLNILSGTLRDGGGAAQ
jgi:predicted AlkP superfamily pyrophosphatase or phosphodiesterase